MIGPEHHAAIGPTAGGQSFLSQQFPNVFVGAGDNGKDPPAQAGFIRAAKASDHIDAVRSAQQPALFPAAKDLGNFRHPHDRCMQAWCIRHQPGRIGRNDRFA